MNAIPGRQVNYAALDLGDSLPAVAEDLSRVCQMLTEHPDQSWRIVPDMEMHDGDGLASNGITIQGRRYAMVLLPLTPEHGALPAAGRGHGCFATDEYGRVDLTHPAGYGETEDDS